MNREELKAAAVAMLERSYVPYSHFPVGAALECADGSVFTGCNVENAGYSPTLCAERVAVGKAVSEGHTDFVRIAVAGRSENYCVPCGVCRQVLTDFAPEIGKINPPFPPDCAKRGAFSGTSLKTLFFMRRVKSRA